MVVFKEIPSSEGNFRCGWLNAPGYFAGMSAVWRLIILEIITACTTSWSFAVYQLKLNFNWKYCHFK